MEKNSRVGLVILLIVLVIIPIAMVSAFRSSEIALNRQRASSEAAIRNAKRQLAIQQASRSEATLLAGMAELEAKLVAELPEIEAAGWQDAVSAIHSVLSIIPEFRSACEETRTNDYSDSAIDKSLRLAAEYDRRTKSLDTILAPYEKRLQEAINRGAGSEPRVVIRESPAGRVITMRGGERRRTWEGTEETTEPRLVIEETPRGRVITMRGERYHSDRHGMTITRGREVVAVAPSSTTLPFPNSAVGNEMKPSPQLFSPRSSPRSASVAERSYATDAARRRELGEKPYPTKSEIRECLIFDARQAVREGSLSKAAFERWTGEKFPE